MREIMVKVDEETAARIMEFATIFGGDTSELLGAWLEMSVDNQIDDKHEFNPDDPEDAKALCLTAEGVVRFKAYYARD